MTVADLPAVPDPSGQPRPPAAPRVEGPWQGERYRLMVAHHRATDELFVASTGDGPPLLESPAPRPPGGLRVVAAGAAYAVLPVTVLIAIIVWFAAEDRTSAYLTLA